MPYILAVASSCIVIWKQPSPSMLITIASGRPTLAPIAAGTPKPIVPAPPDVSQRRGWSISRYWAAHIWCWPTPVVQITSRSRVRSRSRSITYSGLSGGVLR